MPQTNPSWDDLSVTDPTHPTWESLSVTPPKPAQSEPPDLHTGRSTASDVYEIGRQLVGGAVTRAPEMVGSALEWWAPEGSEAERLGKVAKEYWREKGKGWEPDLKNRGIVASTLIEGAAQAAPSLLGMGAAALNPVAGAVAISAMFGGQQAQDTYDKGIAAGLKPEEATQAAYRTGLTEGFGETVADIAGAKLISGAGKAIWGAAKGGAEGAVKAATSPEWAMRFAKDWAANAAIQSGTEYGQGYGEAAVEKAYGVDTQDPNQAGVQGARVALGMSALLGIPGAVSQRNMGQNRAKIGELMNDPGAPPELRMGAAKFVASDITSDVGKEKADAWLAQMSQAITQPETQSAPAQPTTDPTKSPILTAPTVDEAIKIFTDTTLAQPAGFPSRSLAEQAAPPIQPVSTTIPEPSTTLPGVINGRANLPVATGPIPAGRTEQPSDLVQGGDAVSLLRPSDRRVRARDDAAAREAMADTGQNQPVTNRRSETLDRRDLAIREASTAAMRKIIEDASNAPDLPIFKGEQNAISQRPTAEMGKQPGGAQGTRGQEGAGVQPSQQRQEVTQAGQTEGNNQQPGTIKVLSDGRYAAVGFTPEQIKAADPKAFIDGKGNGIFSAKTNKIQLERALGISTIPEGAILAEGDKPFAKRGIALARLKTDKALKKTHRVVPIEGGYGIAPRIVERTGEVVKVGESVHQDAGEPVEAATPAVIEKSLNKGDANTKLTLAQMKEKLLTDVDGALASNNPTPEHEEYKSLSAIVNSPSKILRNSISDQKGKLRLGELRDLIGYTTFDVPGDGKFKVLNTKKNLESFRDEVAKAQGFKKPTTRQPETRPALERPVSKSSPETYVKSVLSDIHATAEDFQNAMEAARMNNIDSTELVKRHGERAVIEAEAEKLGVDINGMTHKEIDKAIADVEARNKRETEQAQQNPQTEAITKMADAVTKLAGVVDKLANPKAKPVEAQPAKEAEIPIVEKTPENEQVNGWTRDAIAKRYSELLADGREGVSAEPSDYHYRVADAILNKDAYRLDHLANGLNDKAKIVFTEVTGVKLPKQQGATWAAIREWAGLPEATDNKNKAWKQVVFQRQLLEPKVGPAPLLWVNEKVEGGFNELRKVGRENWLSNAKGEGFNLSKKGTHQSMLLPYIEAKIAYENARNIAETTAQETKTETMQIGTQLDWREFKKHIQNLPLQDSFGKMSTEDKANISAAGETWTLQAVNAETLKPVDAEVDTAMPIIIGMDGDVLDGRNRLQGARASDQKAIAAWVAGEAKVEQPTEQKPVEAAKHIVTPGMSIRQKEEILGDLIRDKIIAAPSFNKLMAADKSSTKAIHGKVGDNYEEIVKERPWDLLSSHAGIMNAKSARATTLRTLANAVISEANLPMQSPGTMRGAQYRIDWDRLAEQKPVTPQVEQPKFSTSSDLDAQVHLLQDKYDVSRETARQMYEAGDRIDAKGNKYTQALYSTRQAAISPAMESAMIEAYNADLPSQEEQLRDAMKNNYWPEGWEYRTETVSNLEDMYGDDRADWPKELVNALGDGNEVVTVSEGGNFEYYAPKDAPSEAEFNDRVADEIGVIPPATSLDEMLDESRLNGFRGESATSEAFKAMAKAEGWSADKQGTRYFDIWKNNPDPKTKEDNPTITLHVRISDHSKTSGFSRPDHANDIHINIAPSNGRGNEYHGADTFESALWTMHNASLDADGNVLVAGKEAGTFSVSEKPVEGMSVARVHQAILKLRSRWLGFRKINIVQSVKDLPAGVGGLQSAAWHGSPHDYEAFSMDKVGTGEGAQAYGHGLYFAGSRDVAEFYKHKLSGLSFERKGERLSPANWAPTSTPEEQEDAYAVGRLLSALKNINVKHLDSHSIAASATSLARGAENDARLYNDPAASKRESMIAERLHQFAADAKSGVLKATQGKLYQVELAPSEDEYLLWDKPLSEQSEKVKAAFKKLAAKYGNHAKSVVKDNDTGEVAYRHLGNFNRNEARVGFGNEDAATSKDMHDAGIRGIKYLDGSSRNRPLKDIKQAFLNELPEDSGFDEVMELVGTGKFSAEQDAVLRVLEKDDWLGYDYPAQAISAALGKDLSGHDPSAALKSAVAELSKDATYNYVIFSDEDVSITAKFSKGVNQKTEAIYDPRTNSVYLIADNIATPERAVWVAVHETSHAGLRMIDRTVAESLDKLAKNSSVSKLATAIAQDRAWMYGKEGMPQSESVEEAFAELSAAIETDNLDALLNRYGVKMHPAFRSGLVGAVNRVIEAIRNFIAKVMGRPVAEVTDAEVYGLIKVARGAIEGKGTASQFEPGVGAMASNAAQARFYSQLHRVMNNAPDKIFGNGKQVALWLQSNAAKFEVKKAEIEATGLVDWLNLAGKVTKADVLNFLDQNGVQVKDVTLGSENKATAKEVRAMIANGDRIDVYDGTRKIDYDTVDMLDDNTPLSFVPDDAKNATKFASYQLPGGKSYKELLLTLPSTKRRLTSAEAAERVQLGLLPKNRLTPEKVARYVELNGIEIAPKTDFKSSHYDQPNILAHIRFNERTDAEGKRVLFLEEIQSDWGQKGKKEGFKSAKELTIAKEKAAKFDAEMVAKYGNKSSMRDNMTESELDARTELYAAAKAEEKTNYSGIPSAPFVTDTKAWTALALKRMIRYSAENGFDKIAWTTGIQQADRYSLAKQIDSLMYAKRPDGNYLIKVVKNSGDAPTTMGHFAEKDLEDNVGKEIAKKIIAGEGRQVPHTPLKHLENIDLKVGGTGMKGYYDQIVPQVANDILKKLGGGKVESTDITIPGGIGRWEYQGPNASIHDVLEVAGDRNTTVSIERQLKAVAGLMQTGVSLKEAMEREGSYSAAEHVGGKLVERAEYPTQPGFTITPELRAKVMNEGMPLFSKSSIIGDTGRARTPEQLAAFKNVGRSVTTPTVKERMQDLWKDAGKKLAQGLVDQFRPIRDLSTEAYALMRLSKGASGAFEVLLNGGQLKLNEGVYDFDENHKGGAVDRLLIPLQGEADDFLWWVAANRAEKLSTEDREHLFTAEDIEAMKTLADGETGFDFTLQNGQTTRNRAEIYADSLKTFNEFNKNTMDMAEQSGLIDGESRKLWESEFYVPFYRVEEDGIRGMNIKSGVVRQQAFKQLKGGTQKLNSDLLDNTLMNWAHLLDAAAKNRAAKASLEAAERVGVATEVTEPTKKSVWFMDEGQKRHFVVDDPYVLDALVALEYAGMKNPVMNAMGSMKHALTVGVTASPFFKVRNLIRDSMQAIAMSGLDYNAASNIKEGWKLTNPKSDEYFRLMAGGGTIHFGTMFEGSESRRVRSLVEAGVDESTILDSESKYVAFYKRMIEPSITAYNELGNRGEAVNRASLYDQLTKQGMGHAQASLMARDLLDFSMQGAWTSVRFLNQTVPFFNARLQGLYKLGRATREDPRRMGIVLGATAMASITLMLAYSDDDDWKKREDWDRDNYWWFKIGGEAFRIPKPFEIGAIASLAERGVELFASDEMTGERFKERFWSLLGQNLSMNPVPQLVKPILDVYANKDSFTGRPIETMGMERLEPEYRYTQRTSMAARAAGELGVSPVQVDHLIRGYFGWLGTFVVGSADVIAKPLTGQIPGAEPDYMKKLTGGMVAGLEDAPSRYVSQMYEQVKEIEQAHGTWRYLLKTNPEAAAEYRTENLESLNKYKTVEQVKRAETALNFRIRMIERSSKTPEEKRVLIRNLNERKDMIARSVSVPRP